MIDQRPSELATHVNMLNICKARKVVYQKLKRTLLPSYPSFSELKGVNLALPLTHNLAELAGAVTFAAVLKMKEKVVGKKVVAVMTGGNINCEQLVGVVKSECESD